MIHEPLNSLPISDCNSFITCEKIIIVIFAAGPVTNMNKPLLSHIFIVFEVIQNHSDWVLLRTWMGPLLWAWIITWYKTKGQVVSQSVANPGPRIEFGEICTEIWPPGYRSRVRSQVLKKTRKSQKYTFQKYLQKSVPSSSKSAKTTKSAWDKMCLKSVPFRAMLALKVTFF